MINKTPGTALWDLAMRSHQLWQMFVDTLQDQGIDPLQTVGWKKTGHLSISFIYDFLVPNEINLCYI